MLSLNNSKCSKKVNYTLCPPRYSDEHTQHIKSTNKPKKSLMGVIALLLMSSTSTLAKPPSYYRFTPYIYEQDEKINSLKALNPKISSEQIDAELLKELERKKELELEKNCLQKITTDIEELKEQLKYVSNIQLKKRILASIDEAFSSGFMIGGFLLDEATGGLINPLGGVAIASAASLVIKMGRIFIEEAFIEDGTPLSKTPIEMIIQEMRVLEKEYKNLKTGLVHEPISELERQYVKQKRHMTDNPNLQKEIERSLIQSRIADYYFQLNTPAIEFSLGLPLEPKILLDVENIYESKKDLAKRFYDDQSFSIYTDDIKQYLLGIIMQIATNSVEQKNDSSLRLVLHWLGSGSTGKSTAAKAVFRFLGLPWFEKRITNPGAEINMDSIGGGPRPFQGSANPGWLLEALIQTTGGWEKVYQNGALILDDFPVNDPQAQSILLNITDPEKKKIYNELLQAYLQIARLNIIIISNEDFKSLKSPEEGEDHTFIALKTRFITKIFPKFNEEQLTRLAKPYLEQILVSKHKPPFIYEVHYVDPTKINIMCNPQAFQDMGFSHLWYLTIPTGITEENRETITIRELKNVLENTLCNYFTMSAQSKHSPLFLNSLGEDKDLKYKALTGNPEATTALVKKKMSSLNDRLEEKKLLRRLIAGHIKNGNMDEAKICLKDSLSLGDWEVWREIAKHLPTKIERPADQQLLEALLNFLSHQNGEYQFADQIGNHLYQIWLQSTHNVLRDRCLKYAAKLGNQDAFVELVKIHLLPQIEKQAAQNKYKKAETSQLNIEELKKLTIASKDKYFNSNNRVSEKENCIYREIINSTNNQNHFSSLINFINYKELFKSFSSYKAEERKIKLSDFIENFKRALEEYDENRSSIYYYFYYFPYQINKKNLIDDLTIIKTEYAAFEKQISI